MRTELIVPALLLVWALAPATAWATCANLLPSAEGIPADFPDEADEPQVLGGSAFAVPAAMDPGKACVWLHNGPDGPLGLDATVEPCSAPMSGPAGRCTQVTLKSSLPLMDAGEAWLITSEVQLPVRLNVESYHPCGRRPLPADPPDHEVHDGDKAGVVDLDLPIWVDRATTTCLWIDDAVQPIISESGCATDASCVRVRGLKPGEHTVVAQVEGRNTTTLVHVPDTQCVLPTPDDTAPRTPISLQAGKLRLYLDRAPPDGTQACLTSPGTGLTNPLVGLEVSKCEGRASRGCVDVHVPPLAHRWTLGVYDVDVIVGDGTTQRLSLRLMESRTAWVSLYLLALLGLVLSSGFLFGARRHLGTARFSRRLELMHDAMRRIEEDHEPLIAKLRALMVFAHYRLDRPWWSLRRAIAFDHFEPALQHAEQLMKLSARKRTLWNQASALALPPTAMIRFNRILRQLDRDVLHIPLPMDSVALEALNLPSEERAKEIVDEARYRLEDDVLGNLSAVADTLPPPIARDDPRPLDQLLEETMAEERQRLAALAAREKVAPLALREADIRLDVARALEVACTRMNNKDECPDLDEARAALSRYREVDFREPQPHSIHLPVLMALRWRPLNRRVASNLLRVISESETIDKRPASALVVRIDGPSRWATFVPQMLKLQIVDVRGNTHWTQRAYLWRRLLEVRWRAEVVEGKLTIEAGAEKAVEISHDGRVATWRGIGPSTVAFATDRGSPPWRNNLGKVHISAQVKAPGTGEENWRVATEHAVAVYRSEEERLLRGLQLDGVRRLGVSMVLTAALAGVLAWQATQGSQGELPYIWAFLLPFGVDMTTVALPGISGLFAKYLKRSG